VADLVCLCLLGKARVDRRAPRGQAGGKDRPVRVQPRPLRLLAFLALNWKRPHRREEMQDLFWSHKPSGPAANNLRQALPPDSLCVQDDTVQWNPAVPPWVDALAFEAALETGDLDTALSLYVGPFLPDAYDEWAQLERERLSLRYLTALEARAERCYEARQREARVVQFSPTIVRPAMKSPGYRMKEIVAGVQGADKP
jgi:DNA-binding SARP family transcriptional activator